MRGGISRFDEVGPSAYAKGYGGTGPTRQGESLTTQSHAWVAGLVRQGALSVPTRAGSAPIFFLVDPGLPHVFSEEHEGQGDLICRNPGSQRAPSGAVAF